jgi:predicted nucleic acid-binding protein
MATTTEAYVDTSALVAFADRSDTYHALFARLFSDPPRLLTTSLVVAEGQGWFLRRYDPARALQFLAMIEAMTPLRVVAVGPREIRGGTELLRRFSDQRLTMADAVGLYVMETLKVRSCWATDRHLGLTGMPLVTGRESLGEPRAGKRKPVRTRNSR